LIFNAPVFISKPVVYFGVSTTVQKTMKKKNLFTPAIIILVLILLPLVSYYYIREGFHFYKDQMEALSPKAELSEFLPGLDTIHAEMLEIWHIACSDCNSDEKMQAYSEFLEFSDDFKGNESMYFRSVSISNDSAFFTGNLLLDRIAWSFHQVDSLPVKLILNSKTFNLSENPHFVIVDKDRQIRNIYSAAAKGDIGRLMTHTAMLMPKSGRKTVDIMRESEK